MNDLKTTESISTIEDQMQKHSLKLKSMRQSTEIESYRGLGNQVGTKNGLWIAG